MSRSLAFSMVLTLALACTGEVPERSEAPPERSALPKGEMDAKDDKDDKDDKDANPPSTAPTEPLGALALGCDGAAISAVFAAGDLAALASDDPSASVRLLATWERARKFSSDGSLEPVALETIVAALTSELGHAPPAWWVEQLGSGRLREGDEAGPPYYDVGLTNTGDRRGKLVPGPGSTRVRPGVSSVVSASEGKLVFDLSMGRLELGPLPTEGDDTLELARARAGTTIYYASFSRGSGGFRFPLHALRYQHGPLWDAEVCGPDRKEIGGLGYLSVEIVVLEPDSGAKPGEMRPSSGATGVAVFTAESHGVALDVFDPETGARTLAWSSDFWFSR